MTHCLCNPPGWQHRDKQWHATALFVPWVELQPSLGLIALVQAWGDDIYLHNCKQVKIIVLCHTQ